MATSQPQSDTGRFLATTTPLNRDGQLIGKIKADFAGLVPEMDHLVTISLEAKLPRRIIPLLSEKLALRRARIVQGGFQETNEEFQDTIENAQENGLISEEQAVRVLLTDTIFRARRGQDGQTIWVAVEASKKIHTRDIQLSLESATALRAVFGEEAIPVVTGYSISRLGQQNADDVGVIWVEFPSSR